MTAASEIVPMAACENPMASYAFVSWEGGGGARMAPLATFGWRLAPFELTARLVCVDPPLADRETLSNAADVRGAIALVVRGGCSFATKARRLRQAGALAMILANNTREEPFAMFTMAADDDDATHHKETSDARDDDDALATMPCVMMCLQDVRDLFKLFPPTVSTGVLSFEIPIGPRADELLQRCERQRLLAMQQHQQQQQGSGSWIKRKTSSLIKIWDAPAPASTSASTNRSTEPAPAASSNSPAPPPTAASEPTTNGASTPSPPPPSPQPLFAFVQWATSAETVVLYFAPLADFCRVANGAIYEGTRVVCDPLRADAPTLRNASELNGAVALVQRGAVTFPAKLERIQRCGAVAAIVGNDDAQDADAAFVMSVDQIKVDHVTLPAVMVSRAVFERLQSERPARLRVLCLAGDAAAECIARNGQELSLRDVALPRAPASAPESESPSTAPSSPLAAFHAACRRGDHGACLRLLDELCSDESARRELATAADCHHLTALHHACAVDLALEPTASDASVEHVVALLLQLGASPSARDVALVTPLHVACLRGHTAAVKRMLATTRHTEALTTAQHIGGMTPLHLAALAGDTATLELLLTANARRHHENQAGVEEEEERQTTDDKSFRFVGVEICNVNGETPLHLAARACHVECVRYLVAANAPLDARDRRGRSALRIACELVNDATQTVAALHIVETLLDAGASMVDDGDADDHEDDKGARATRLLLDCIQSKAVRRELEVSFLRRETHTLHAQTRTLVERLTAQTQQTLALKQRLQQTHALCESHAQLATARELVLRRQQRQIDQLQTQMKTLLHVVQNAGGLGVGVLPCVETAATTASAPATAPQDDNDEHRAQEAALARDLGKRCFRQRQFALAETYFERSLELFALPGVARLLDATRRERERRVYAEKTAVSVTATGHETKRRLQQRVAALSPAEIDTATRDALQREIAKLDALDDATPAFETAVKWIEWLLSLPLDASGASASLSLSLSLHAEMFDEIERMERATLQATQQRAASLIQRVFRERYAVPMLRRSAAVVRLQAVARGWIARRRRQRMARDERSSSPEGSAYLKQPTQANATAMLPSKATLQPTDDDGVDVYARRRLQVPTGWRVVLCAAVINDVGSRERCSTFQVVQLVEMRASERRNTTNSSGSGSTVIPTTTGTTTAAGSKWFVWRRWGMSRELARQSVLSGPFETLGIAQSRFQRECAAAERLSQLPRASDKHKSARECYGNRQAPVAMAS
ncbi:hypothetical protein PINS_up006834 [Pythium insidiosum]|nr:hypothetical protein PINS_up006834 [Pythium insidiosum]